MPIESIRKLKWKYWVWLFTAMVGVYFCVHVQSFLSFVFLTVVFFISANIPILVTEKVITERQPVIKVLGSVIGIPVTFFISGLILFSLVDGEPFNFETANQGPYPVWYVNPFTHNCSYRLQRLTPGDVGGSRYWYSWGECSQEEKDRIFQQDYAKFSSIRLRGGSSEQDSITGECQRLSFNHNLRHRTTVSEGLLRDYPWMKDAPVSICEGLSSKTKACEDYKKGEEIKDREDLRAEKEMLKREFLSISGSIMPHWGVSPEVFAKLCPNHKLFDFFLSSEVGSAENGITNEAGPGIVSDEDSSWIPDPRPLPEIMKFEQKLSVNCRKFGGVIMNGSTGINENKCIGASHEFIGGWTGSLKCGNRSTDTKYVVYYGDSDKWNFTIDCKKFTVCNGPQNALCNSSGCQFSQECLVAK